MFITFEGLDGSGKTTLINMLVEYIKENYSNIHYILTREPGGKDIKMAEKIRQLILSKESELSPKSEALLYSASRRIHLEKVIWPALKNNNLVLCDRYIDSFYAYQGFGRDLGIQYVEEITELIIEKTYPDITVFFDINPEESKKRRLANRLFDDRMEDESDEFHKKIYLGYQFLIEREPKRFIVVDATKSIQDVFNQMIEKILSNDKFMDFVNAK